MEKERKQFFEALPGVIEDLAKHPKFEKLPVAKDWMKKVPVTTTANTGDNILKSILN